MNSQPSNVAQVVAKVKDVVDKMKPFTGRYPFITPVMVSIGKGNRLTIRQATEQAVQMNSFVPEGNPLVLLTTLIVNSIVMGVDIDKYAFWIPGYSDLLPRDQAGIKGADVLAYLKRQTDKYQQCNERMVVVETYKWFRPRPERLPNGFSLEKKSFPTWKLAIYNPLKHTDGEGNVTNNPAIAPVVF
jgi:hypothetical protein